MNCKQGDLAYVFKSSAGNYGRVVICLKLHPAGSGNVHDDLGPVWEVDKELSQVLYGTFTKAGASRFVADCRLRPLRGDLSNDEIEQKQPLASALTA